MNLFSHLLPHLLYLLGDLAAGVLNLLLSSEEQQDVTGWLTGMDLDDGADRSLEVVALRVLRSAQEGSEEGVIQDISRATHASVLGPPIPTPVCKRSPQDAIARGPS